VNELDKRLDLDIDSILQSPKLRLQLSPAELDKKLLELYKNVSDGPSGDVLRVIGGGNDVALQDLYVKGKTRSSKNPQSFFGQFDALGDDSKEKERTASQWVNSVLKRNLPKTDVGLVRREDNDDKKDKSDEMTMSVSSGPHLQFASISPRPRAFTDSFCVGRSRVSSFSLLI